MKKEYAERWRRGESSTKKSFTTASREGEIKTAAAVMGRKGGKVKSEAKTKAARENGQKGGRPRKMNIREKPSFLPHTTRW